MTPDSQPRPTPDAPDARPLALLGGAPAFAETLHVGRPDVADRAKLLARIDGALDRRWFTNDGPLVKEFEAALCRRLQVRNVVATSSGTTALELTIRALGLTGEVIVPSFTFVATVHALQWQGITPVFADVDPRRHLIDPAHVERLITPRTSGIVGVHTWGRPCAIDALSEIARRHKLALLFDAAHAIGCTYQGAPLGRFGAAEVFSFHATKCVQAFEGGAVATDDDALAAKLRLMRNFGFAGYDRVECLGINGKLNEINAAMGLTSLEALDAAAAHNRDNFSLYKQLFADVSGLSFVDDDEGSGESRNFQYVVLECDERSPLTRDQWTALFAAENVLARRYFFPGCHRMEPYRTLFPAAGRSLPITEQICEKVWQLPTGPTIGAAEIRTIAGIAHRAIAQAGEIRTRLKSQQV